MLAEEMIAQAQGGQPADTVANDDDTSTDDEFIPIKKKRSVEPQPSDFVKKYGALHLPKMVEPANASRRRRDGCKGKTFVK